jgi:hypothetical protein
MTNQPAVIFPDGSRLTAKTWRELESILRNDSWNPSDKEKFRAEFAKRARNWSGTEIDSELISRQWFEELERAGLLLIER